MDELAPASARGDDRGGRTTARDPRHPASRDRGRHDRPGRHAEGRSLVSSKAPPPANSKTRMPMRSLSGSVGGCWTSRATRSPKSTPCSHGSRCEAATASRRSCRMEASAVPARPGTRKTTAWQPGCGARPAARTTWLRTPEASEVSIGLLPIDPADQSWLPPGNIAATVQTRQALLACARAASESDPLTRIQALWEAIEFYVTGINPPRLFDKAEAKRIRKSLPGDLDPALRDRALQLLEKINEPPLLARLDEESDRTGTRRAQRAGSCSAGCARHATTPCTAGSPCYRPGMRSHTPSASSLGC